MLPSMITLASLISFGFVMSITPGPNNIMLWASGANFGLRRTLPHMLGINCGFGSLLLLCGLGLGALFEAFPVVQLILKVVGAIYLLYLAYRLTTASFKANSEDKRPLSFWEAAGFQYANPKAWVMGLTAMSTFALIEQSFALNALVITLIFMVINLPCISVWALFGTAMGRFLSSPRRLRIFNGLMATLLVATVVLVVR